MNDITAKDYTSVAFTLKCSEKTMVERHKNRGDSTDVSFEWLRLEPYPGVYVINTDDKSMVQIVNEIRAIIG